MSNNKPIMLMGCTSDAGKSWIAALLCRRLVQRGVDTAPFKAQNMSNNAAATDDGGEIGRAQYLQAQAAKVAATTDMNPVLIKPHCDTQAQVIVQGKRVEDIHAHAWHERKAILWPAVESSLGRLQSKHQQIVIEGAGSPAEVNLRKSDIVNMEVALACEADVYLVVDIDRGGAYAHLLGTMQCMSEQERALVKGFVINKFRGEQALLDDANRWIEQQTGVPIVAVIPYTANQLPEEDSFKHRHSWRAKQLNVALIAYPFASNLEEFDPLFYQSGINIVPVTRYEALGDFDAVILPGAKQVGVARRFLSDSGLDTEIAQFAASDKPLLGICGGMQLLGGAIRDPYQIEGGDVSGLGLLPIETELTPSKTTEKRQVAWQGHTLEGYEIHVGNSVTTSKAEAYIEEGTGWQQGNIAGTYLHGLFENQVFTQAWLSQLGWSGVASDWQAHLDQELDRLCGLLESQLDAIIDR